jgi:putative IMPACT (imprinted ancient) family translation regulator
MQELAASKFIEKKSRFYTHLYKISSFSEVEIILKNHRLLYKNANHHCYAYIFMDKKNQIIKKFYNDGEVGSPGKILLEILRKYQLNQHLIIISRVFGGIKLGVGGVRRAFKTASNETFEYYMKKVG